MNYFYYAVLGVRLVVLMRFWWVFIFVIPYLISIWVCIFRDLELTLTSLSLMALAFLGLTLTRGFKALSYDLGRPFLGIFTFILCLATYFVLGRLFVWNLGWIDEAFIFKLILLFLLPSIYLWFIDKNFMKTIFSVYNFCRGWWVSLIMISVSCIPAFFYGLTYGGGLHYSQSELFLSLLVGFAYFMFKAALPEEFFFRVFLIEHLREISGDNGFSVIASSLVFGYVHVFGIIGWYEVSPFDALIRATLIQVVLGIVFGILWIRMKSLLSLLMLHASIDGITNVTFIARLLFG